MGTAAPVPARALAAGGLRGLPAPRLRPAQDRRRGSRRRSAPLNRLEAARAGAFRSVSPGTVSPQPAGRHRLTESLERRPTRELFISGNDQES